MPWAQFDDHFHDSEGALRAGPEACGLHLLATTWCCAHLTDGQLPELVARMFIDRCQHGDELVASLVEAGLWERTNDGWRLPQFLDDNRSKAKVKEDRDQKAKSGAKGGRNKAKADRDARAMGTNVPIPSEAVAAATAEQP